MDFEQELKDLITAALKAGVSRDIVIAMLGERAAFLDKEDEDEEDDQP